MLQLSDKLVERAAAAERRRRIFQTVGTHLWELMGGYTLKQAAEVDRVADLLEMTGSDKKRWEAAAWQIVTGTVSEFEAARERKLALQSRPRQR